MSIKSVDPVCAWAALGSCIFSLAPRISPPIVSISQFQKRSCLVHGVIPKLTTVYSDWSSLITWSSIGHYDWLLGVTWSRERDGYPKEDMVVN